MKTYRKPEVSKQREAVVTVPKLNVRKGPSKGSDILGVVTAGTRLILHETTPGPAGWVSVMAPTYSLIGWVMKEFVEEIKDE